MTRYDDYLASKRSAYMERFDESELSRQFIPYFNNRARIRVEMPYDEILTGTVGVTTGWRPSFILMRTSRSIGSCHLLDDRARIIGVQENGSRKYRPVEERNQHGR